MCRHMIPMRTSSAQVVKRFNADPTAAPPPDFVRCRQCDECLTETLSDRIGRALAEANTCYRFTVFRLSYAPEKCIDADGVDHSQVEVLKDMQDLFKRIRSAGFSCRYIYTFERGNNGTKRVHVHLIIFWMSENVPFLKVGAKFWNWHFWPWGHVCVMPGNGKTVAYALKYQHKTFNPGAGRIVSGFSKKPPLGATFFKDLAWQWAKQGLWPEYMTYTVPQSPNWEYRIFGTSLTIFQTEFDRAWTTLYPGKPLPYSERLVKGRVSRAHKIWRKIELERREAASLARMRGEPVPSFPPNPRPQVEGQVPKPVAVRPGHIYVEVKPRRDLSPRSWWDVMPGRPTDDTDPANKPPSKRGKFHRGFTDKPTEHQGGAALERDRQSAEAGAMNIVVRRARG